MSRLNLLILIKDGVEYGPFPWQKIREWIGEGYIPRNAQVRKSDEPTIYTVSELQQLWKVLWRPYKPPARKGGQVDEPIKVSPALRKYITETLKWPYKSIGKNYYRANHLRKELEAARPDPQRAPFKDSDYPKHWDS